MGAKKGFKSMNLHLQSVKSSLCGYYAIAWILAQHLDIPFRDVFKKNDHGRNLKRLVKLFKGL